MASRRSVSVVLGGALVVASTFVWIACSSSTTPITGGSSGSGGGSGSSSGSASSSSGGSSSGGSSSGGSSSGGSSSGGSSSGGSSSGGSSGSSSGSSSGGLPPGSCPGTPCTTGTCCANTTTAATSCETTCAPADTIACSQPSDCAGSTDGGTECCAVADLENNPDGAAFPHCVIQSLQSYCGACKTTVQLNCTAGQSGEAADLLHVCSTNADCAGDGTGVKCCAIYGYNVCFSSALASIGGLTCQ